MEAEMRNNDASPGGKTPSGEGAARPWRQKKGIWPQGPEPGEGAGRRQPPGRMPGQKRALAERKTWRLV